MKNAITPYTQLVKNADAAACFPIPSKPHLRVPSNRLKAVTQAPFEYPPEEIEAMAAGARLIIAEEAVHLARAFLKLRREHGSAAERAVYEKMSLPDFLDKLFRKRPLMFMNEADDFLLRDGRTRGRGGFDTIEKSPLLLSEYNSYPEMQLAALLGASTETFFINNGRRNNMGQHDTPGGFEARGVYIGLVGARFERPGFMEWQHLTVTPEQNTAANGYGPEADPESWVSRTLAPWAQCYREGEEQRWYFPDYETASQDASGKFLPFQRGGQTCYLNTAAYKHRMRLIAEPFLLEANERAKAAGTSAYVIAVGYGIGVWALEEAKEQQAKLIIAAFADVISDNGLPHISDLCFSWYPDSCTHCGSAGNGEVLQSGDNQIRIHFNRENPMEPLSGPHAGKLLVASYAWDGNSYPGNEYWIGALDASGDPAAACCSLISELQNPDVNPAICGANVWVARRGKGGAPIADVLEGE